MRQSAPQKRGRGRPGGRRNFGNSLNRTYDSNGPDVKVRGTAMTIFEKYQTLARDASSSGDRIGAENYLQHAEHYYRLMQAAKQAQQGAQQNGNGVDREHGGRGQQHANGEDGAGEQPPVQANQQDAEADDRGSEDRGREERGREERASNGGNGRSRPPMSPAELVAEVEAMEQAKDGDGGQAGAGQDSDEPAPRKPRRRRKPAAAEADAPVASEAPSDAEPEMAAQSGEAEPSAS